MAISLKHKPGDMFFQLEAEEANALLSLLYELKDPSALKSIATENNLEISDPQCERIATLWDKLVREKR